MLLKRAQHRLLLAIDSALEDLGISAGHWAIMRETERYPGASGNELAAHASQTRQSLGEAVLKLEKRGLLERVPGDGRRMTHCLTDMGHQALERCNDLARIAAEETLSSLSAADRISLAELIMKIVG